MFPGKKHLILTSRLRTDVGSELRSALFLNEGSITLGDEESDEMVRVKSEGRSKGCQACRKRKIKVCTAMDLKGSVADEKCSVIKPAPHVRIAQEQGSNVPVPRQDLFSFMQIRRQDSPKPTGCVMNETTQ